MKKTRGKKIATGKQYTPVDNPIAHEEWDFNSCPDHQLPFCLVYEYARQSPAAAEEVAQWRQTNSWPDLLPFENAQWMRGYPFVSFLKDFPEFPGTPWLKISFQKREARLANYPAPDPMIVLADPQLLEEHGRLSDFVVLQQRQQKTSVFPIKVNWSYSDAQLAHAFRALVFRLRRVNNLPADERHAPTTHREHLKKLSALRLLEVFDAEGAIEHSQARLNDPERGIGLYQSPVSIRRAAQEAKQRLFDGPLPSMPDIVHEIIAKIPWQFESQFTPLSVAIALGGYSHQELLSLAAMPESELHAIIRDLVNLKERAP